MKTLFFCLLAGLLLQTADVGRACEYCRMAAEDPEAARLALAAHASAGGFPLQSTINQFKLDAPPAVLTAPPATSSVATSAADLPATTRRPLLPVAKVSVVSAPPAAVQHPAKGSSTWANAGLLGFFGCLGIFGWRTRRTSGPVS